MRANCSHYAYFLRLLQSQPRYADLMEETIRLLLEIREILLNPHEIDNIFHGFTCLGVAHRVPEINQILKSDIYIWHVPAGILPISDNELIRWGLDAPEGRHWILSERDFSDLPPQVSGCELVIWGPEMISKWIGDAVMSGELQTITDTSIAENDIIPEDNNNDSHPLPVTLQPIINIENWLAQRGYDGESHYPVFLEGKLWTINGRILGPDGESEESIWSLMEDPWSNTISILENIEQSPQSANLRIIPPLGGKWLDQGRISHEADKLLEVRKKGQSNDSTSSSVKSMLLERWVFDSSSAIFSETKLLLPAWVVHIPDERALHARNGRTYEF